MKHLLTCAVLAVVFSAIGIAQTLPSAVPTQRLKGHWTFDNAAALGAAAVGTPLVIDGSASATEAITSIDGPSAGNKAVHVPKGKFFRATPGMQPNGISDTLKKANRYTLVMDFRINARGAWRAFYQTDPTNASDADLFIRSANNSIGHSIGRAVPGYSFDTLTVGRWYRLVIVANLGVEFTTYLDGQLLHKAVNLPADGNQAIESVLGLDEVLFFGDDDGDDGEIDCSEIALYDTMLTTTQISSMGGYGSIVQVKDPVLGFAMTNPSVPLATTTGTGKLELMGGSTVTVVTGPKEGVKAVQLKSGQYFKVNHGLPANGTAANGLTNNWSVLVDFKLPDLAQAYDLVQTDTTNKTTAEFTVTDAGKAGVDTLGYSSGAVVVPNKWYRLIMAVNGGKVVTYYLEGAKVYQGAIQAAGRFAISAAAAGKLSGFLVGAQSVANHPNMIEIAQIQVWNRWVDSSAAYVWGHVDITSDAGTGKGGSSVLLDGSAANMYVRVPMKPQYKFDSTKSFTVEAWIKPFRLWSGDPAFLSNKDWTYGSNAGWAIALDAGGVWQYNIGDGGVTSAEKHRGDIDDIGLVNDEAWHHIAVVVDRTSGFARAYQDGVLKKSADISLVKSIDTQYDFIIGQDGTGDYSYGNKYGGYIDEVRIWGAALDSATIKAWKTNSSNIASHPKYAELRGYWRFNSVAGDSTADASTYGNWGKMKNGASLRRSDVALPVREEKTAAPSSFSLGDAYPNPFNPSTTIRFSIPFQSLVELNVYNVLGQRVAALVNGQMQTGTYSIVWNAAGVSSQMASGVYFYRLTATGANNEQFTSSKKVVLTK